MGTDVSHFAYELVAADVWPATGRSATADELVADLTRLLDVEAVLAPFAIVFDEPVPLDVRRRVTDTVRAAIVRRHDVDDETTEWVDDLVDETGWQGERATIDDALAPCFSGRPDDGDLHHSGVWADERTFLHIELDALRWVRPGRVSWAQPWVALAHWHPGSMTSGSWSDDLLLAGPPGGAGVLLGVRAMDEDGLYWTISPRPADPADAARIVEDFIHGTSLSGAESHLLPLLAHGFPCDGSAAEFTVDLLPGTYSSGYEVSAVMIAPPDDVVAELVARATLDADGARALRDAIVTGATTRWVDASLEDLTDEWHALLARLDSVVGP